MANYITVTVVPKGDGIAELSVNNPAGILIFHDEVDVDGLELTLEVDQPNPIRLEVVEARTGIVE